VGSLDKLTAVTGGVRVVGWTADPDVPKTAIKVAIYEGRTTASGHLVTVTAKLNRPDVGTAFPKYGPNHGYSVVIKMAKGTHTICTYGINNQAGAYNPQLGCKTVTIP
jgi:hypothetical protein